MGRPGSRARPTRRGSADSPRSDSQAPATGPAPSPCHRSADARDACGANASTTGDAASRCASAVRSPAPRSTGTATSRPQAARRRVRRAIPSNSRSAGAAARTVEVDAGQRPTGGEERVSRRPCSPQRRHRRARASTRPSRPPGACECPRGGIRTHPARFRRWCRSCRRAEPR
jgi:hypothetical protein